MSASQHLALLPRRSSRLARGCRCLRPSPILLVRSRWAVELQACSSRSSIWWCFIPGNLPRGIPR